MAAFYRELRFRSPTYSAHMKAWHRADDLPGVSVLTQHARRLGFLERSSMFSDEQASRLVLEVSGRTLVAATNDDTAAAHPYRRFQDFVAAVRPDVGALIEDLRAEHAEVTEGSFAFQTRDYERPVRERFASELAEAARGQGVQVVTQLEADADPDDHVPLFGRVRGRIPGVLHLAGLVRRSGLVDPDEVLLQLA